MSVTCFLPTCNALKLLKFNEFVAYLNESTSTFINEGGAYGHLEHPFEDIGLTFLDLEEMLTATVNGAFGPENFVQEKTDGQNIMISWKNGQLIAARNKDRKSTRLNSSHVSESRMPSSA